MTKESSKKFECILIANRGEIALRALRSCKNLGLQTVSVHSEADKNAPHTWLADRTICIGPAQSNKSYLSAETLLHVAKLSGCDAIYPGYGFLSEKADFAKNCEAEGIKFIGPSAEVIRIMGDKSKSREVAKQFGIPVVPGSETSFNSLHEAESKAADVGFPILLKARSGGGGRGMRLVSDPMEFADSFSQATQEAEKAFGDGELVLERYFPRVRHVEVQVFGDGNGGVMDLGERDCTVQRRYQKLLEEAPSPAIDNDTRKKLIQRACNLTRGIKYEGAGTVEFILDIETSEFFFIEMNTRIQVEHPVTEALTGLDLVSLQFSIAAGEPLPNFDPNNIPGGHAIEFRINAEDWKNDFVPSPGRLNKWRPPLGSKVRFDSAVYEGYDIPPFYDSMIGKLIVHGTDRENAIAIARDALDQFEVEGIATTIGLHRRLIGHADFLRNNIYTSWVDDISWA